MDYISIYGLWTSDVSTIQTMFFFVFTIVAWFYKPFLCTRTINHSTYHISGGMPQTIPILRWWNPHFYWLRYHRFYWYNMYNLYKPQDTSPSFWLYTIIVYHLWRLKTNIPFWLLGAGHAWRRWLSAAETAPSSGGTQRTRWHDLRITYAYDIHRCPFSIGWLIKKGACLAH